MGMLILVLGLHWRHWPGGHGRHGRGPALRLKPGGLRWARRRPARLIGGAVAVAAAAAVAAIVVPAVAPSNVGHSFAGKAWAVEWHGDGTVTVTLSPLSFQDRSGLQRALRADGIAAYVTSPSMTTRIVEGSLHTSMSCYFDPADDAPPAVQKAVITSIGKPNAAWTIRPAAMPEGSALLIAGGNIPQWPGSYFALEPVVLRHDRMPACIPIRAS
jgi:hypothetical protein